MPQESEPAGSGQLDDIIQACEAADATLDEREWLDRYPQFRSELSQHFANRRWFRERMGAGAAPAAIRSFENYELLEEIGRGGMGIVYRAREKELDRIVAVKTMIGGQLASEADVRRFAEEARCAARLRHPHIVTVYAVGEHEGLHYFSMEFVEGRSLAGLLEEGPLRPELAARYLKAVAEAIDYAHQRGVLHRDLKPSNILIDARDGPRVTDFGLAKLIQEGASGQTATGAILGTASYMAPEQADGRVADVNIQSDVYALGGILYESLTGEPPFRAATREQTLAQVLNVPVRPPRLLDPAVPVALESVCLKCLEKDPRKRYATAGEVAEDCQRFLDGKPVLAQPQSYWGARLRRYTAIASLETNTANLGLVAGIVIALLIGLAPSFGMALDPARQQLNTMAAVVALMAFWWLTEAIPSAATGLLPLVLLPLLGVLPIGDVSRLYMHDVILMTLGGLLIAIAVEESGLIRRLAFRMISMTRDNPSRIVLGFMIATGGVSLWVSNVAATIIVLPVALRVLSEIEHATLPSMRSRQLAPAVMLGIAYAATIGGTATPFGTLSTQNFLATYGRELGVTQLAWMRAATPFALLMGVACWMLLTRWIFPVGTEPLLGPENTAILQGRLKPGPMTSAERRMLAVSAITILLWIFSDPAVGWGWAELVGLPVRTANAVAAVGMALLCFVLPAGAGNRQRLMEWEWTTRLPWGVFFFFGGGLALGAGIRATGLDAYFGIVLAAVLQDVPSELAKMLASTAFVATVTQMMSNFATTEMTLPILDLVAKQLALEPRLVLQAGILGAFCSFLLPASTPPNAVVYGSGKVSVREMMKAGFWLALIGIVLDVACVTVLSR